MEQFNDTPIVNGTAYPTFTVEPKAYRLRILNAANDRFFNFSGMLPTPERQHRPQRHGQPSAAPRLLLIQLSWPLPRLDPNIFPTPDTTVSPAGPNWI